MITKYVDIKRKVYVRLDDVEKELHKIGAVIKTLPKRMIQ